MKNIGANSKKGSSQGNSKSGSSNDSAPSGGIIPKTLLKCYLCSAQEDNKTRAPFLSNGGTVLVCCQCAIMSGERAKELRGSQFFSQEALGTTDEAPPQPKKIMELLNESIMGQVEAKRGLAVAVARHLRRSASADFKNKTNLLIFGPTGSGKTEMVKTIAREFGLTVGMVTTPNIVPRGYKGGDEVDSIVVNLLIASGWDVRKAERGIIFLDEIDKMLSKKTNSDGWSAKASSIQGELLKMIEGDLVRVKHPDGHEVTVDTSKVLFIGAGAFTDLKGIVEGTSSTRASNNPMGFQNRRSTDVIASPTSEPKEAHYWAEDVTTAHFVEYGITPEFYGRFGSTTFTRPLTKENHREILNSAKSPIHEHIKMFAEDGVQLVFAEDFFDGLIENAMKSNLGARGVATALNKCVDEAFMVIDEYEGKRVTLTKSGPVVSPLPMKAEKSAKKFAA